jgi:hypothetical protein
LTIWREDITIELWQPWRRCSVGSNEERKEMMVDIILVMIVMFVGGLLGLFVEFLKYFYPIYMALLLLLAAELLTLLGRMISSIAKQHL